MLFAGEKTTYTQKVYKLPVYALIYAVDENEDVVSESRLVECYLDSNWEIKNKRQFILFFYRYTERPKFLVGMVKPDCIEYASPSQVDDLTLAAGDSVIVYEDGLVIKLLKSIEKLI